jgi:DUF971 family protein
VLVQAKFNGDTFADITWANHAIQNEWLQVIVLADANTHLAELRRNSPSAGVRGEGLKEVTPRSGARSFLLPACPG